MFDDRDMSVAVIAAHPDDELLGVGGTVLRHVAAGHQVFALVIADGATSRYSPTAVASLQEQCRDAARILGFAEIDFLDMPDQRLDTLPKLEIVQAIEEFLDVKRPNVVYAHHWGDVNADHRIVSEAVVTACRPVGESFPSSLSCFETPSATEWGLPDPASQFVPTRFVDVTSTIERKLEAMARYISEVRPPPHPRSLEALRSRAAYWGQFAGCAYAEPFVVARDIL